MDLTEVQFGFFLTATGVGALVSSLTAERVAARIGPARSLRIAMVAIAAMLLSPLLVQPLAVAAAMAFGAYFIVLWDVITVSLRQQIVPDRLLGRINSAYRLVAWGGGPVGAVLGGTLAEVADLRAAFVAAGIGALALTLALRPLTDNQLRVESAPPSTR